MEATPVHRWILWIVCFLVSVNVKAAQTTPDIAFASLQKQLSQPDETVDFATAKLTIDRQIDPETDSAWALRELDRLVHTIQSRTPSGLAPRARMDVLLSVLYTPGPWNENRPFTYDLDDPLGHDRRTKLLVTYLHTRKGNCVSMPILVAILGQRLGLDVTLTTAPQHIMVKFADGGSWLNVEATSGYKWDSSYERDLGINARAIRSEIYLRPLRPTEAAGLMMSTLMEKLAAEKRPDDLMTVADMALAINPKDAAAMVEKANAYYLQL